MAAAVETERVPAIAPTPTGARFEVVINPPKSRLQYARMLNLEMLRAGMTLTLLQREMRDDRSARQIRAGALHVRGDVRAVDPQRWLLRRRGRASLMLIHAARAASYEVFKQ